MHLTEEQRAAVDAFARVYDGEVKRLSIGGLAGTGKTTIISAIVDEWDWPTDLIVGTPTGKAAHVLRTKGVHAAQTVHSALYKPREVNGVLTFDLNAGLASRVAIIDEASMLNKQLVRDIEVKVQHVLYVGDHGQLEPIGEDPGIMRRPDIRLEHIHRQAADSPIIQFAHHVRTAKPPETFGDTARVQRGSSPDLLDFDVVLCGYNNTRQRINAWARKRLFGYTDNVPRVNERVICLRNNKDKQVWNGMTGIVTFVSAKHRRMSVVTDDGPRYDLSYDPRQFGAKETLGKPKSKAVTLWDFAYALTVHKSQGSEWSRVAVLEEIARSWSADRWRYTAATRAADELRWVLR